MDHMNSTRWRTSSYSGGNGGECVQVAAAPSAGRVLAVTDVQGNCSTVRLRLKYASLNAVIDRSAQRVSARLLARSGQ